MKTTHMMHPDGDGQVYCHAFKSILALSGLMDTGTCRGCPYFAGSLQGEGVECVFENPIATQRYTHVYEPIEVIGALNSEQARV